MQSEFADKSRKGSNVPDAIEVKDILAALEAGEIAPHYQPQICLASGQMDGVEALIRWFRPNDQDGTQIFPNQFIPLVEASTPALKAMTLSIVEHACQDMAAYIDTGHTPVKLSVNMSATELSDIDHINAIAACVKNSNFPTELLTLEITESTPIDDMDTAIESLVTLRKAGIKIALDDLCTGHSKFEHVMNLPCDIIKLDKSEADKIGADYERARLQLTINIAHGMKKTVVIEGIETEAQSNIFSIMGADQGQGWLYAKAMSISDLMSHDLSAPLLKNTPKNKRGMFLPRSKH